MSVIDALGAASAARLAGPDLGRALSDWIDRLGPTHVVSDVGTLSSASTATFATRARVQAILRPGNLEDVQACVRIANRHGVALYPVSSGKNWGYGSRAPIRDGVIIDLGRMNRIVEFDEDLAYVTLEPGVTQRQLFEFLRERGARLWMDATGSSPDCSIIGNTMERGFGHTPMGDHCANAGAFEVVLPTGDVVRTGYARFDAAGVGALGHWGVGPSLDGLFSQSNLGIVTRMSVWLMPQPESFRAFFFMCRNADGLQAVIDALRPLRLDGTLRSTIHIGNDYKVLAGSRQYPWPDMNGRTPLDVAAMERLRRDMNIGAWNGCGGLYGSRTHVKDAARRVRRALRGKVDRLQFVDDRRLELMKRFATPFRVMTGWDVSQTLSVLAPVYGLLKGVPTDGPMSSVYWRKRMAVPSDPDPDRDGCGLLWCSPVLPSSGPHAAKVTGLAASVLLAHGFEPQMSLSLATERSAVCVTTISYDREVPGEDARAMDCYEELTQQLLAQGYPPYRANLAGMGYADGSAAHTDVVRRIKDALDPNGVLSPGRYAAAEP
jgi:4-cresol dehydrogenase (hydroxylating) flavoprotein subunit